MTYKTGDWGAEAKKRSKNRKQYFLDYQKKHQNHRKYQHEWFKKNYEKHYKKHQKILLGIRDEIFRLVDNKCQKCGYNTDIRALQIDHINGEGNKERKLVHNRQRYLWTVLKSMKNNEGKYQVLCANCNFIKRLENNEMKRKEVV